jgi:rubredoxin
MAPGEEEEWNQNGFCMILVGLARPSRWAGIAPGERICELPSRRYCFDCPLGSVGFEYVASKVTS